MRILFVIPKLVSYRSFLRELCRSLLEDGMEVHIACSGEKLWSNGAGPDADGVQMHAIDFPRGMNPVGHLRAARQLRRMVAEIQPDVVHAHFSAALFTTALARKAAWPKTFGTFHGVSFLALTGWKATILRRAESWAAKRFDTAWVLTDDDRRGLEAAAPKAVVRRMPGFGVGCDLARYSAPAANVRAELRRRLGCEADDVVFAFVGRFAEFKGFALVVRAFLQLRATKENVRLLLIGIRDRLHPTGLTVEEEKALAASADVVDLGFRDDVERWLPAADVMVFPSRREGMPVCVMEALALGIPVITAQTRGCREVVRHRVDGLVLPMLSLDCLRSAMQLAVEDESLRQRWGACARSGRDRFDRNHFVEEQKRLLAAVTSTREEPRRARAEKPSAIGPLQELTEV
ncbi:MAG TPA: glycosyltransferase [Chthoniobacterales bacterium]|nr:glycosyltransferase [Chthoniobacterales bacterium]